MWIVAVLVLLAVVPWSLKRMRPQPPASDSPAPYRRPLNADESAEIDALVTQGSTIAAVKRLREMQSLSLVDAKHAIDAWQPGTVWTPVSPTSAPALTAEARAEVEGLIASERKIEAIKRFRELTGSGLRDAKDAVENWPGA